jgi:D-alanine-D-alanine ligase
MAHPFAGKRVAVVMGGLSAEREVSLDTGAGVLAALLDKGWDAIAIDWQAGTSLARLVEDSRAHVVWNALHGTYGEDGAVQGLCACLRVPCTGSGILASALAMDKVMSKRIFESNGVPTPRWRLLDHDGPADGSDAVAALADWRLPCVVKPANEGSSVGVSVVETAGELAAAVALARPYHGPILVEDYIAGTEVFVGILDGRVLGSVEVRPATKFYDYDAKYKRTDTKYLLPPELPREVVERAEHHALAAYTALGCSGHARPDLRIARGGEPYVLEVNTLPGMTKTSLLPKISRAAGIDYAALCEQILASAR